MAATVQSVDRALLLLREVGRRSGGLVDLAERTGLPTSTASRLLGTLEHADAIARDADGSYRVGPAIHALTAAAAPAVGLSAIAHPHLVELSEILDEACCLAVVSGRDIVTVDQVDAPKPVRAENWTGTRVPLHAGGAGLVAMASWSDAEIDEYLAGDLSAPSEHTITDPAVLRRRIRRLRGPRVMWTHGEYVDGLSSASAAVIDGTGRAIGAVYTYGPTYRYPPARKGAAAEIAREVLLRAERITAELGGRMQDVDR